MTKSSTTDSKTDGAGAPPAAPKATPPGTTANSKKEPVPALVIRSLSPHGFRRCGRQFGTNPVTVALSDLTKAEVAALKAEPRLAVQETTA